MSVPPFVPFPSIGQFNTYVTSTKKLFNRPRVEGDERPVRELASVKMDFFGTTKVHGM